MDSDNAFGLWLRKRRLERSLTQEQLADLADLSRRWLVEIEAGRAQPTFSTGLRLLDALQADLTAVAELSRSHGRPVAASVTLKAEEADTRRRELLRSMLAIMTGADLMDLGRLAELGSAPPSVETMSSRDAEAITSALMGHWYRLPPVALLPAAGAHLAALKTTLPGSRDVCSITGWTALLVGGLLGKLKRRGDAYSHYALADALARDAGDSALLATVLVKRRGLLYWRHGGDPSQALDLLDMADVTAGPAAPPLLRAVILATRAEDRATVRDEVGCLRDLEAAETALRPSEAHFFGPRTPAELGAVRGTCESLLGRHREAVDTFDWVLREMDPTLAAWRATVATDREAALAAS